ncbi:hypothetical protein TorRG33x02_169980 [Trema orientale]|uniref:Uncharacterized protein n=1 Tax=Trema orientale TaxID=63057 RepID=A0A2P5ENR6_TREOI|nr:hypothetical protein TorRG33x02_169980 [Trema orientale]
MFKLFRFCAVVGIHLRDLVFFIFSRKLGELLPEPCGAFAFIAAWAGQAFAEWLATDDGANTNVRSLGT